MILAGAFLTSCATSGPSATGESTASGSEPTISTVETTAGYGLNIAAAVEVCKPAGEREYLRRLRCADGKPPTFSRSGSGGSRTPVPENADQDAIMEQMFRDGPLKPGEPDYHIVDYYDVYCGAEHTRVIMDMYHCAQDIPSEAPPGFTIVPPI